MADEFEIEEIDPSFFITVRHLAESHHYTFQVVEQDGGRHSLGGQIMRNGNLGKHTANYFLSSARAFAEREARKAGMID
jgi:hypothetical protein